MAYQFIHIEAVSMAGRDIFTKRKKKKIKTGNISVDSVLGEVGRLNGYISHIKNPLPPVILFGNKEMGLEDVRRKVNDWIVNTKDARGHKTKKSTNCLLSGMASWPPIGDDEDETEYFRFMKAFEAELLEWLKGEYGDDLILVLRHDDEPFKGMNAGKKHYHWHFFCVKKPGQRFDLHPGLKARSEYDVSRQNRKKMSSEEIKAIMWEGRQAYLEAMSALQDRFNLLGKRYNLARIGEGRIRRSRREQVELEAYVEKEINKAKSQAKEIKAEAIRIKADAEKMKSEATKIKAEAEKTKIEAERIKADAETIKAEAEKEKVTQEETIRIQKEEISVAKKFMKNMEKAILDMKNKLSGGERIAVAVETELNAENVLGDEKKEFYKIFFTEIPAFARSIIKRVNEKSIQKVKQESKSISQTEGQKKERNKR